MAKRRQPADAFSVGVRWIAENDLTHDTSITGLRFSPAVCLLAHLCEKTPAQVAEAVIAKRRTG